MATISKTPSYNLKVVIQDTGIKPDTLRAWERRYGLPQPERTAGGHRLYSAYDIETLKWLHTRQEEGLSISRAVDLWKSLIEEGKDPLLAMPYGGPQTHAGNITGESLDELRQAWIDSALAFDETNSENILAMCFARYPAETVVVEVLQKGLSIIGDKWYNMKVSVQQEHYASALAMRRINALIAAAPPATRNSTVLIINPSGEDHTFVSLIISLFLRLRGYGTVFLGPNIPTYQIGNTLEAIKPDLVVLVAMTLGTAASLLRLVEHLQDYDLPSGFGGRVFNQIPELRQHIPSHFLGDSIPQAVESIENLLKFEAPPVEITPPIRELRQLAEQFHDKLPSIEAQVWQNLGDNNVLITYLNTANFHLQEDIFAALYLGNIGYLNYEITWVNNLLKNVNIPPQLLGTYLLQYSEAISSKLGGDAALLVSWLQHAADNLA